MIQWTYTECCDRDISHTLSLANDEDRLSETRTDQSIQKKTQFVNEENRM